MQKHQSCRYLAYTCTRSVRLLVVPLRAGRSSCVLWLAVASCEDGECLMQQFIYVRNGSRLQISACLMPFYDCSPYLARTRYYPGDTDSSAYTTSSERRHPIVVLLLPPDIDRAVLVQPSSRLPPLRQPNRKTETAGETSKVIVSFNLGRRRNTSVDLDAPILTKNLRDMGADMNRWRT